MTDQKQEPGELGKMGSIADLGAPAPGGAFDEHQPPDAALVGDCVHCGFCLPTCPTYVLWGEEMDSPRGRIHLMKQGLEGEPMSTSMVQHIDRCLGCMACVTACPSGVPYDKLIEATRPQVERRGPPCPPGAQYDNLIEPPRQQVERRGSQHRSVADRALREGIFQLFPRP